MSALFTEQSIRRLKPKTKRYVVRDSLLSGFVIRVAPSGVKTFGVVYRVREGRGWATRGVTLGQYNPLTVSEARAKARTILADVQLNRADPARALAERRTEITVEELGKRYLEDVHVRRKPSTAKEYDRQWHRDVLPEFGHLCLSEVVFERVDRWHDQLRAHTHAKRKRWAEERAAAGLAVPEPARLRQGGMFAADRALLLLSAFFEYAKKKKYLAKQGENPAREVQLFEDPEKSRRTRHLTPAEAARLGKALSDAETVGLPPAPEKRRLRKTGATAKHRPKSVDVPKRADRYAVTALRLLAMTGWRESEVLSLEWTYVDHALGRATLRDQKRGELNKQRQLGAPALALLAELPRVKGSPYCFPSPLDPKRRLESVKRLWYAVRHAAGLGDVRLHDLRHTFASAASASGESLPLIGKLLGHKDLESTMRYAHAFDDPLKRAADQTAQTVAQWLGIPQVQPSPPSGEPTLYLVHKPTAANAKARVAPLGRKRVVGKGA
jgi:integrase